MGKMKKIAAIFFATAMAFAFASCKQESDEADVDVYYQTETTNTYYYTASGTVDGNAIYQDDTTEAYTAIVRWSTDAMTNTNSKTYRISFNAKYYDGSGSSYTIETVPSLTIEKIGSKYYCNGKDVSTYVSNPESSTITLSGTFNSYLYNIKLTRM